MAQLGWQPFSSYLIVKVPHRYLMPALVLGWGLAQTFMAVCHNFGGLIATRFFRKLLPKVKLVSGNEDCIEDYPSICLGLTKKLL
jgi:hypothetical protein